MNGTSGNSTEGAPRPRPPSLVDYGSELLVTAWITTAFSMAVIGLRLVGNYRFHTLQVSDLVNLFALVLLFIAAVLANVAVNYGYGQSAGSLELDHELNSLKYSAISQAIVVLSATAGRVAFILYLLELLATRKLHRMIMLALIPCQVIANVISVFLQFLQCGSHVDELFSPGRQKHCMTLDVQIDYAFFQGSFNSACDLLLAVWPIYIFWRFNWTLRIKLVLVSLLSLGIFAMIASLVKTIAYPSIIKSTNPRTNHVLLIRWMFIEAGVVLITASIPCIRPILMRWFKKLFSKANIHKRMDSNPQSTVLDVNQLSQTWKARWMTPYVKEDGEGSPEAQIVMNITTHIFAGDREFLDKHMPGIVREVEVTVVTDEIPLTEGSGSGSGIGSRHG